MQGSVLAGIKCAISIDTLGKECLENQHDVLYTYKNCVKVPPLSFVDDIIGIANCGPMLSSLMLSSRERSRTSSSSLDMQSVSRCMSESLVMRVRC